MQHSSHLKESGIGKLLLVEFRILGFGIQKNPSSTERESEIHRAESLIQDCLGFPYMGIIRIMLISQSQFPLLSPFTTLIYMD